MLMQYKPQAFPQEGIVTIMQHHEPFYDAHQYRVHLKQDDDGTLLLTTLHQDKPHQARVIPEVAEWKDNALHLRHYPNYQPLLSTLNQLL